MDIFDYIFAFVVDICVSTTPFECIYSSKVYLQPTELIYSFKIHGFLSLMRYIFRWHWLNPPYWTSLMYWVWLLAWMLSIPVNTWHCPRVHQCVCHQCWLCSTFFYKVDIQLLINFGFEIAGLIIVLLQRWCYWKKIRQGIISWCDFMAGWTSCQICKIAGYACAGNARNVFPATTSWRSRHASRHVRGKTLLAISQYCFSYCLCAIRQKCVTRTMMTKICDAKLCH